MQRDRSKRRRGLTLIELIIVLTILVAVAGLIVPTFPGLLSRTGHATNAASVSDVDNMFSQYYATNLSYPDQLDALVDSTGALYSKLPPAVSNTTPASLTVTTLSADEVTSLSLSGIKTLHLMRPAPVDESGEFDATFDATLPPDGSLSPVTIDDTVSVVRLSGVAASEELRLDATGTYIVFGFGDRSTAVGEHVLRPPVGFGSHRTPEVYQRILVVFQVFASGSPARFVGSLAIDNDGGDNLIGHAKPISGFRKHPER